MQPSSLPSWWLCWWEDSQAEACLVATWLCLLYIPPKHLQSADEGLPVNSYSHFLFHSGFMLRGSQGAPGTSIRCLPWGWESSGRGCCGVSWACLGSSPSLRETLLGVSGWRIGEGAGGSAPSAPQGPGGCAGEPATRAVPCTSPFLLEVTEESLLWCVMGSLTSSCLPALKPRGPSWDLSALCEDPGKLLFPPQEALPHQPSHVH